MAASRTAGTVDRRNAERWRRRRQQISLARWFAVERNERQRDEGPIMNDQLSRTLSSLEGRQVSISLRDGTRIDDGSLVSCGRNRLNTLWVFVNDEDVFVPRSQVTDIWEG